VPFPREKNARGSSSGGEPCPAEAGGVMKKKGEEKIVKNKERPPEEIFKNVFICNTQTHSRGTFHKGES